MTEDAPENEAIAADMSGEAALGLILVRLCDETDRQLAVFLESDDESGPHKARVALRRLTTALDAFAPILRRKPAASARAAAKRIFRALGEVRDADVFLAAKGEAAGKSLTRSTAALRSRIRKQLRKEKAVAFAPALKRAYAAGELLRTGPRGLAARAAPVGGLAATALDAAWAAALAHGDDLAALPEEERHEFRKDMKTLRYLVEFFAPLWPAREWEALRGAMQDLQDELGVLNDLANARARGRAGAAGDETQALARAALLWSQIAGAAPV
ncbi:CHAD domain-containing protein [Pseudogemmobacter humi]|uniref:CHAD domain protein n=1 Tax=Pseudogemmobacter humi TaxID=2483812 RepID=A0A3P5XE79_9RHOB|nr:CHAD domain-containing protein [Pseudogemmobacter humi]VDC33092.1 CHAD domain protein [Pseudogemmobacter humi]